jgi:hypothetical protein
VVEVAAPETTEPPSPFTNPLTVRSERGRRQDAEPDPASNCGVL